MPVDSQFDRVLSVLVTRRWLEFMVIKAFVENLEKERRFLNYNIFPAMVSNLAEL